MLRAWERRYGVLRPERTSGGFRLYSPADERRVRRMQEALASGLSTAEAARTALEAVPDASGEAVDLPQAAARLSEALDGFDEASAGATLDALLAAHLPEVVVSEVVLPYLRDLGRRWETGEVDVAQEHFASNLLRARLVPLVEAARPGARAAVLACAPDELHDLPLLMLAVALSRRGWRTVFLGAAVPVADLATAVGAVDPEVVVVAATSSERLEPALEALRRLSRGAGLWLAGPGATRRLARRAGAVLLTEDPITAAERIDTLPTTPAGGRP